MARSSTSYRPKWKLGNTSVIRVPKALAPAVLRFAHDLDLKSEPTKRSESMNTTEKLAQLKYLQAQADAVRQELGISQPGKVTFLASCGTLADDAVVVEADGFGGARASIVEGHYPIDYVTKFERSFQSEAEAEAAAGEVAFKGVSPSQVLGVPA
jgi:hypothetical protein